VLANLQRELQRPYFAFGRGFLRNSFELVSRFGLVVFILLQYAVQNGKATDFRISRLRFFFDFSRASASGE
jgi:hypothetical protein